MSETNNFGSESLTNAWDNMIEGNVYRTEDDQFVNPIFQGESRHLVEDNMAGQNTECVFGRAAARLCGAPYYFEYIENQ